MSIQRPTAKKLLHLVLWVVITLIFLFDRRFLIQKAGLGHFAECTIVRLTLIISLSYFNIFYLIPKYIPTGKYMVYSALLLLSVAIYVTLQSFYDVYLYGFVIGFAGYKSFWRAAPLNY